MTRLESALNPVTMPDVNDAVQLKDVPGTLDNKTMAVESPEHIDFERGLFVTNGTGEVNN